MVYSFKYCLTESEYLDVSVFTAWSAPWQKKTRLKSFLTILLSCLVFSSIASFITGNNIWINIAIPVIVSLIVSYLFITNAKYSIRGKIKKILEKEENTAILSECELEINDEKISDSNSKMSATYRWDSIVRYVETPQFFILYINDINALVIPKRLFASKNERDEFDKFVSSKIPLASAFRSIGL